MTSITTAPTHKFFNFKAIGDILGISPYIPGIVSFGYPCNDEHFDINGMRLKHNYNSSEEFGTVWEFFTAAVKLAIPYYYYINASTLRELMNQCELRFPESADGDKLKHVAIYLDPMKRNAEPRTHKRTLIKLGRLFQMFLNPELHKYTDQFVTEYKKLICANFQDFSDWPLMTVEDGEEISDVYMTKAVKETLSPSSTFYKPLASSCMRHPISDYQSSPHHPTEAYGSGDWQLAYIKSPVDGRIGARILLAKHKSAAMPLYASGPALATRLRDLVTASRGFDPVNEPGLLTKLKLDRLESSYGRVVCPYLDEGYQVDDCGDYLKLARSGYSTSTSGVIETDDDEDMGYCEDCEDSIHYDDLNNVDDRSICDTCLRRNYTRSDYSGEYINDTDVVEVIVRCNGRTESWSQDEASDDACYSEYHDSYLHYDIAIKTQCGETFMESDIADNIVELIDDEYYIVGSRDWDDKKEEIAEMELPRQAIEGFIIVLKWLADNPPLPFDTKEIAIPELPRHPSYMCNAGYLVPIHYVDMDRVETELQDAISDWSITERRYVPANY
jgi:hypothetical protein